MIKGCLFHPDISDDMTRKMQVFVRVLPVFREVHEMVNRKTLCF